MDPLLLHLTGVPYILFRPYKGEELLNIVTQSPLCIKSVDKSQSSQQTIQVPTEDDKWVWSRYCAALWDSFGKSTAQDLISFRRLAEKLWRPFVVSIEDGTYSIKDFSKLMIAKRHLFQGENALQNNMAITSGDATQMKSERGWLRLCPVTLRYTNRVKFFKIYLIIQSTSFALPTWLLSVHRGKTYYFLSNEPKRKAKRVDRRLVGRKNIEK